MPAPRACCTSSAPRAQPPMVADYPWHSDFKNVQTEEESLQKIFSRDKWVKNVLKTITKCMNSLSSHASSSLDPLRLALHAMRKIKDRAASLEGKKNVNEPMATRAARHVQLGYSIENTKPENSKRPSKKKTTLTPKKSRSRSSGQLLRSMLNFFEPSCKTRCLPR